MGHAKIVRLPYNLNSVFFFLLQNFIPAYTLHSSLENLHLNFSTAPPYYDDNLKITFHKIKQNIYHVRHRPFIVQIISNPSTEFIQIDRRASAAGRRIDSEITLKAVFISVRYKQTIEFNIR